MKKTIGILGGMGPEATSYFFNLVIGQTRAGCDQEHIPVLIWNNPLIPPRTEAIFQHGPSPLPLLVEGVKRLERGGAGLIVMPCITAHHWASEIAAVATVPFVSLIDESVRYVKEKIPGMKKAGLVASSGTVATRIWHRAFEKRGIGIIVPESKEQDAVMKAIFGKDGIKAGSVSGRPRAAILRTARRLIARGAEAIIAGCTEVPLVLRKGDLPVPLIEPMAIGALACVKKAGYATRGDAPL
jgi:aspartate racemase